MNVPPGVLAVVAVVAAYLIGAVPFGYLTAKWLKGVDIRTVGSGNIGATNVGRAFGLRFFLLVFAFDLAKGLVPTWGFPRLVAHWSGAPAPPDLAVAVALATILGHNFPVYLKFRGGKGVATSLGALLALDPVAAVGSALGFGVFLAVTKYVSMSSLLAGLVFVLLHFLNVDHPWDRKERALTVLTVALLALLVARHRKNLGRIALGTEPKVSFRRRKSPGGAPSGRVAAWALVALAVAAVAAAGVAAAVRKVAPGRLALGRSTVAEVARVGTGHQRAEHVAFADGGRLLAVTCPRYDRLVLYRVTDGERLEPAHDLALDGKPVAVCPAPDRLYVLLRPPGDERHVTPGWWQAFDLHGEALGGRVPVGFYPDDMALSPDGRHLVVLTSGRAEGSADRPAPALDVYPVGGTKAVGRVTFDAPGDDPIRLALSSTGQSAVVTLAGADEAAAVDLFDPAAPRVIGRTPLAQAERPYPSRGAGDVILMPTLAGREAVLLPVAGLGDCVASTLPHGSGLEFSVPTRTQALGRLTLRGGALGFGSTRPTGLAYSPERGLIAVANRSGGVHLVAIHPSAPEAFASAAPVRR